MCLKHQSLMDTLTVNGIQLIVSPAVLNRVNQVLVLLMASTIR